MMKVERRLWMAWWRRLSRHGCVRSRKLYHYRGLAPARPPATIRDMRARARFVAGCVGVVAALAHAPDFHAPRVRLPLMPAAPIIDGHVHEEEWQGAARMAGFGFGPKLAPLTADFWVGSD